MPKVTYVQPDGSAESHDVPTGKSLMLAAISNNVAGILGECGGQAMCATCHVYVDEEFLDRLAPPSEDEDEMLEATTSERRSNSRLSCQLICGPELDGLIVTLPEDQA
ncbi:2Fe-2S iron-sulfur cluster-binding protein [Dactylosporangium sp. NPDC000555]|uniref:2Fe-2S iron-sulfur cluster-binding protein n=1 Tax=Dactylosporangium sp. NPDC000555 TaxID=3154260 RepID=UPI0033300D3E